jgi:hypothetical protein
MGEKFIRKNLIWYDPSAIETFVFMNTDRIEQCTIPSVGSIVFFYQNDFKNLTDSGKVLSIIKNDFDESNPILEIEPKAMNYDKVWRTVKELISVN